jgi:hypothetical protein
MTKQKKQKKQARRWCKVKDIHIRHLWACKDEECKETNCNTAEVSPDWYEQNGTPICRCGQDMAYVKTEIYK